MEKVELTGKKRLVYEACLKIEQGKRLIEEGQLELDNLIPESSQPPKLSLAVVNKDQLVLGNTSIATKAPKTLRKSGMIRRPAISDQELKDNILRLIDENEKVTSNFIHEKMRVHQSRITRMGIQLRGDVTTVVINGRKYWVRVRLKAVV